MTPTDQEAIDAIEADRRRRERELFALLMLLTDDSRKHAQSAIRLGVDPVNAARNVIMGASHINQPGGAGGIAGVMLNSYADGVKRVFKMAELPAPPFTREPGVIPRPQDVDAVDLTPAQRAYDAWATTTTQGLYRQIAEKIVRALRESYSATVNEKVRALRESMEKAGFTRANPSAMELIAEQSILKAHGDGMYIGYRLPPVDARLVGFRHHSVVDNVTTDICLDREGFTLNKHHPYWLSNWPSLHYRCRSVVLPIFHGEPFVEDTVFPTVAPMAGFGRAPEWVRLAVAA